MSAPYYESWRETLPIQCRPVPTATGLQPSSKLGGADVGVDPTIVQYPNQTTATTARSTLETAGVQTGYYGVYKRWDGLYQLWPNGTKPEPGTKVA